MGKQSKEKKRKTNYNTTIPVQTNIRKNAIEENSKEKGNSSLTPNSQDMTSSVEMETTTNLILDSHQLIEKNILTDSQNC
jgi:hypothetical protein